MPPRELRKKTTTNFKARLRQAMELAEQYETELRYQNSSRPDRRSKTTITQRDNARRDNTNIRKEFVS
jgi:hypothetical protein